MQHLTGALTEILGFPLNADDESQFLRMVDVAPEVQQLDARQFSGMGALAERIARRGISRRDDLEVADFTLFRSKLSHIQMSSNLRQLLSFLPDS